MVTAVAAMKQQMAKELAASQSKFSTVSSELIEARAKMRHDGEESRAAHQREMDKTLAEKQATVEKITAALMKEVKDMSEAHTREVLELKANSSQELDTMTEEHIKEKEEVQRENAARLERETGALKRQLAMETGVLTTQLEAMQTAMENELAEERSQIDLTKQKWAAELANLEAETVKTEAERQVCQDAMRKDFEDRDAFIVRIEEELRARTEVIPSPLTVSVSEQTSAGWRAAERRHPTGRERMGSPTLQTLQDPILLLSGACFQGGGVPNPRLRPLTLSTVSIVDARLELGNLTTQGAAVLDTSGQRVLREAELGASGEARRSDFVHRRGDRGFRHALRNQHD
jgi:hypothetical protein